MSIDIEKLHQLASEAVPFLGASSNDLLVAPIILKPKFWLAEIVLASEIAPHAIHASVNRTNETELSHVEVYNNGDKYKPAYLRAYQQTPSDAEHVVSYVVGNQETVASTAKYDGKSPEVTDLDAPWAKAIARLVDINSIFGEHQPHHVIRLCSFVLGKAGLLASELVDRDLKIKKYSWIIRDSLLGKKGDFFAHVTRFNEQKKIDGVGHGFVITNSTAYAGRNTHYDWQPLGNK